MVLEKPIVFIDQSMQAKEQRKEVHGVWTTISREVIPIPLPDYVVARVKTGMMGGHKLRVCVGTDSQQFLRHIEFASVVVIYLIGQGGSMVMRRFRETRPFTLRERLMHEVSLSIDIAWPLLEPLEKLGASIEVHADINEDPRFPSHVAYQEARGYVRGMGLTFKAKPEAFASSCCADALVHS